MKMQGRLTRASQGEFNASDWKSEGHSLLLSSKLLRFQWLQNRRKLIRRLREKNSGTIGYISADIDLMNLDRALVKSSTLLIGYAVEMYLKAGLANSLIGCPEELFTHLSRKFSHNYSDIAKFIRFPTNQTILDDLEILSRAVQADARYPISVAKDEDYIHKTNERRQRLADNARYKRYRCLAKRLDHYAYKLLGSAEDPVNHGCWEFDGDGYLCFRMGGGMPPRITYKWGKGNSRAISTLADLESALVATSPLLRFIWSTAEIYEHVVSGRRIKLNEIQQ